MTAAGERPERRGARSRSWTINIRRLRAAPGTAEEVHVAGTIPELAVSSAAVPEDAEVSFDGVVAAASGGVSVSGTVRAPWVGVCRRCLEEASGTLVVEVREFFRDRTEAAEGDGEDEEAYVAGHDVLDLEPLVHDACILELPLAPLCSESCRGICPTCGANRSRDECACEEPSDPRWAALAELARRDGADEGHGDESGGGRDEESSP